MRYIQGKLPRDRSYDGQDITPLLQAAGDYRHLHLYYNVAKNRSFAELTSLFSSKQSVIPDKPLIQEQETDVAKRVISNKHRNRVHKQQVILVFQNKKKYPPTNNISSCEGHVEIPTVRLKDPWGEGVSEDTLRKEMLSLECRFRSFRFASKAFLVQDGNTFAALRIGQYKVEHLFVQINNNQISLLKLSFQ